MPLISVIIPVYNVEQHLKTCLDSVVSQTLKDIEILLIDDGSTDGSGKICDEYAASDSRIRVIHKRNEGVACARNEGLERATAPYLMFVDSDDWVAEDFCEKPYRAAVDNGADLVIFHAYTVRDGKLSGGYHGGIPVGKVDTETALRFGRTVPWNKLYRRELFDAVRYPAGRTYEDIAVTHRTVFAAKQAVILPDVLYYYRQSRKGSVSNTRSIKNKQDGFLAALQRSEDLKAHGYPEEINSEILWSAALALLVKAVPSNDPLYRKAEETVDSIKGFPPELSKAKKAALLTWKVNKKLFHFGCGVLGWKG